MTNPHDDGVPYVGETVLFHPIAGPVRPAIITDVRMSIGGVVVDVIVFGLGAQAAVARNDVEWGIPVNPATTPWCGDLRRERVRPMHPRRERN